MWYADSYHCPKTFDEYIERVTSAACLPAGKAREILREHAVSGRSKLDSYEAVDFVMKHFPERYEQEVEKVVKYPRWLLAHGLELGYDELCEIESADGVEIITNKGGMGRYATAGDAERVWDAAVRYKAEVHVVRLMLSYDTGEDRDAAEAVMSVLSGSFALSEPRAYTGRGGCRMLYFTASVPKGRA